MDTKAQRKKEKKERKKEKKERKHEKRERKKGKKRKREPSVSSDEEAPADDPLLGAALQAEREKVQALQRAEEEKRARSALRKRRRQEEAQRARAGAAAQDDRERLRQWREAEEARRCETLSAQLLTEPAGSGCVADPRVPLRFLCCHKAVAWESLGAGGAGIVFARRVDAGPVGADTAESPDEW